MLAELLKVREQGRLNPDDPRCMFPEEDVLSQRWLLTALLHAWREGQAPEFQNFAGQPPNGARFYTGLRVVLPQPRPASHRDFPPPPPPQNARIHALVGDVAPLAVGQGPKLAQSPKTVLLFETRIGEPGQDRGECDAERVPFWQKLHWLVQALATAQPPPVTVRAFILYPEATPPDLGRLSTAHAVEQIRQWKAGNEKAEPVIGARGETAVPAWERILTNVGEVPISWENAIRRIPDGAFAEYYQACRKLAQQQASA